MLHSGIREAKNSRTPKQMVFLIDSGRIPGGKTTDND